MNRNVSIRSVLILSASALALAACAGKTPPPAIAYDSDSFRQAVVQPEPPKPVEIVAVSTPLPLPGQLQPPPSDVKPDMRPPTDRVEAANKAALQEPSAHGYINAVQVYPYLEGALYRLYAAPEQVSDIALQPGETLTAVSAGDTVRWVIGDTTSGSGDAKRVHVLVKPFAPGLKTNLVITTDRRTYMVELRSGEKPYMPAVSWSYPQPVGGGRQAVPATPVIPVVAARNYRYGLTGSSNPPWKPVAVYDDGRRVYVEFPRGIVQGEMPPIFVIGPEGEAQIANSRIHQHILIVDRLFGAAELRLGGGDRQQTVRIVRTDGRPQS